MKKLMAMVLALAFVSMAFLLTQNTRAQPTNLWLEESPYTHSDVLFVPGETIVIHVEGPENDVYDIKVVYDPFGANLQKRLWDNVTIGSSGEWVEDYDIPNAAADGYYHVQVWDRNQTILHMFVGYNVQLFDIDVNVERGSYLAGETVAFHYLASYLRTNDLVDEGFIDWAVYDNTGAKVANDEIQISSKSDAIGKVTFGLGSGAPSGLYNLFIWLNDTQSGTPSHYARDRDSFNVGTLSVSVSTDATSYTPGDTVMVSVRVDILGTSVPGADVDIEVYEEGSEVSEYEASNLITDVNGEVSHFFTLATDISDGTNFEVKAVVQLIDVTIEESTTFVVKEVTVGVLSVNLEFDKNIYLSGDAMQATANVQTSGTTTQDVIYQFKIEKAAWPSILLDQEVTSNNKITYNIPDDFQGSLRVSVIAKNSEGFSDTDQNTVQVEYGYMLVDADKEEYNAGDTIRVDFELKTNVMTSPEFFYAVETGTVTVETGPAGTDHFTFEVGAVPPDSYVFVVYAVDDGRLAEGQDTSRLVSGFILQIELNQISYSPGDTITIDYEVKARGTSHLPGTFSLSYGIDGAPFYHHQTDEAKGTVTYEIPKNVNEGNQIFMMQDTSTGAFAVETIYVKSGANPLWWAQLADIPLIVIIVLIWLVIVTYLALRRPRRPAPAPAPREEVVEKPPEETPVEESTSPMIIHCKACGAPIEISTSKRPIEVMCPSCGETEIVQ